jgi:hypothetical protein
VVIDFVSFDMFKRWCVENGIPGAEAFTTDFLVFTGAVAGGAPNGAITGLADVKLSDEYDYYLADMRASCSAAEIPLGAAAATIGGQAYIPLPETQHIGLTLNCDGRNRPSLFRGGAIPLKQFLGQPMVFPALMAFQGKEKVQCVGSTLGTYNPASIAAVLDFTVTISAVLIKAVVLDEYSRYLQSFGQHQAPRAR